MMMLFFACSRPPKVSYRTISDPADPDELREFLEAVEAGEYDADPGLEATVRIVRPLLDDVDE